jgi:hypothetical protein
MTNLKNSTSNPDRRSFLLKAATVAAGSAAVTVVASAGSSVLAYQNGSDPILAAIEAHRAAAIGPDPIFARIATHKKLTADWQGLYDQLDDAEHAAAQEHGRRPIELIHWRGYTIGASEIDTRREQLLEAGEIDPATIEQEYLDANARYQAKVAAGIAWDKTTGLETLRKDVDRRVAAEGRYAKRLARTAPTTAAGVAALIQYVLDDDLTTDESYWHMTALRSAVSALNSMGAAAA